MQQISDILRNGADKVSINTAITKKINFLKEASKKFGSQCIVVSIDIKKIDKQYIIYSNNGLEQTNLNLKNYLKRLKNTELESFLLIQLIKMVQQMDLTRS